MPGNICLDNGPTKEYLAGLLADHHCESLPIIDVRLLCTPGTTIRVSPTIRGLYRIQVIGVRRCTGVRNGAPYVRFALDGRLYGRFKGETASFECYDYCLLTRTSEDFRVI